jgi:hypothetical protein
MSSPEYIRLRNGILIAFIPIFLIVAWNVFWIKKQSRPYRYATKSL